MLNEVKHPAGEWNVLAAFLHGILSGCRILRFAQDDATRVVHGGREGDSELEW